VGDLIIKTRNYNYILWWRAICFVFFSVFGVSHVCAQVYVESVSGAIHSGSEVVRIELSEKLEDAPVGFSVQNPARIALDFPEVKNATGRSRFEINQGNLRTISIVQAGDRLRVVLGLRQYVPYHTELQGKTVVVVLEPFQKGEITEDAHSAQVFTGYQEVSSEEDTSFVKDIDFRRTEDGAGRVIVELAHERVSVNLQQRGGSSLVLEMQDAVLPEELRRRLDVSDFGTPVQLISATQQGERVHLNIEVTGEWEHSGYQNDSQFILDVRPKKVDLSKFMRGPNYTGERLSLNFQNIEVRSLLQVIADFTDFNIVTSDSVSGSLTLRLKDVPWDQALQIIMDSRGLGMKKTGTVLWIAPKDEIDERERKNFEALETLRRLEPLRTRSYQLNYAKAEVVAERLMKTTGSAVNDVTADNNRRFLSERGSALVDERTNQLFVTDIAEKLEELQELLTVLDVPIRQVMIEARIVEARDSFGRALGVRLGGGDLRAQRGGDGGYKLGNNRVAWGSSLGTASNAGLVGTGEVIGDFLSLPATLSSGPPPGSFALSIFNPAANRFLSLELSAMEADGQGRIVSSPRVITADQTKALIEQGTEYPVTTAGSDGGPPTTTFKKAVMKLEVTPQITPEGDVILDLNVNKDTRGDVADDGNPAINTRSIKTQVLVENGGTVVIGGIFEIEESEQKNQVPFLGDLPVLGHLFKNTSKESLKREMMVFITPRVISDNLSEK